MDFDALLDQARPVERTVPLCLRGDLVAEFEALERDLERAQAKSSNSLAGTGASGIAVRMEALREQMQDSTVEFKLRGLPRPKYRALTAAHPPRQLADGKVNPLDEGDGLNVDTFYDALIRACLIGPDLTESQLTRLLDEALSDRQFEQLAIGAVHCCRGSVDVPFSYAASKLLTGSGNGSRRPSDSESPFGDLTAGNLGPDTSGVTMGGD